MTTTQRYFRTSSVKAPSNNEYLDSPVKKKISILVPLFPKGRFSSSVLQCGGSNDVELNGADCKRISGLFEGTPEGPGP